MAAPPPGTSAKRKPSPSPPRPSPLAQQLPLVSARWLLWSLGGIVAGGLLLVYLTMVLLFWQGQWQILFHPDRTGKTIAPDPALPIEHVAFDTTETGWPLLDGWFVPATGTPRTAVTILYLHGMRAGSLAAITPELSALHLAGVDVFAFDYRGFGSSELLHPSEETTSADVEAAWRYLVETRHVPANSIVFYGVGLGGALAADAAAHHSDAAGLVMDRPLPPAYDLLRADPRSRLMPVRLLAHDTFDPARALASSKLPKLILVSDAAQEAGERYAALAADPKVEVTLPSLANSPIQAEALRTFLDTLPSLPSAAR